MTGPLQFGPPSPMVTGVSATDDLPRSPTGRIPQWVVDECDRSVGQDLPVVVAPAPRRRRRGLVAVVGRPRRPSAAGAWWWTSGAPALPDGVVSALPGLVRRRDAPVGRGGRARRRGAPVRRGSRAALRRRRRRSSARTPSPAGAATSGRPRSCAPTVRSAASVPTRTRSSCTQPADPRLRGFVVETVAHETLHAPGTASSSTEQTRLTALLEAVVASLPADDEVHEQIAGSVGGNAENRPTELFAYVGTQVWRDGGLDPQLEAVYARFVTDRAALVAVHTGWLAVLDEMGAAIDVRVRRARRPGVRERRGARADQRGRGERDVLPAVVRRARSPRWPRCPRRSASGSCCRGRGGTARSCRWRPPTRRSPRPRRCWPATRPPCPPGTRRSTRRTRRPRRERARVEGMVAELNTLQADLDPGRHRLSAVSASSRAILCGLRTA